MTKKKVSILVVLLVTISLLTCMSFGFAETLNSTNSTSLNSLTELVGTQINVDALTDYFNNSYYSSIDEEDELRLIVEFSTTSSESIVSDLKEIDVDATLNYTYSNVFVGASISMKAKDVLSLSNLSYVKSVTLCAEYEALGYSADSGTNEGIFDNDTSYQGEGMVVAVIDNAFDNSHTAFSSITSDNLSLTKSDISSVLYKLNAYTISGASASALNMSNKIAYGYDYAEGDTDLYQSGEDHGTHVAGILAGNSTEVQGVVPNAQLVLMKVGDSSGSMYTDTIVAALEDCAVLGVDVVNMSLGSAGGFTVNNDDIMTEALSALETAGISVVCASGNGYTSSYGGDSGDLASSENIDNGSVSSPASYESTISVGNATETSWVECGTDKILANDGYYSKTASYGSYFSDYLTYISDNSIANNQLDYIVLMDEDNIAIGKSSDYDDIDVTNKIVVVSRGEISFTEKLNNAKNAGAIGIIVVNTTNSTITAQLDNVYSIPFALVAQKYGDVLISNATINGESNYEGSLIFNSANTKTIMSSSSSSGVTNDLSLGVDFVAYGTNVYSLGLDQSYENMSGTSMASPNAAGVVAVLKQYIKANATTFGIDSTNSIEVSSIMAKLAMSNTTLLTDINNVLYSPRAQGAGLLSLSDALSSLSYITTYDSDNLEMEKTKIELGDGISDTFTLKFTVSNCNSTNLNYNISVSTLAELLDSDDNMCGLDKILTTNITSVVDENETASYDSENGWAIIVNANSTNTITITMTLTAADKEYLSKFTNGTYIEGYVQLNCLTVGYTGITLSTPFIGFYGDWDEASSLDITYYKEAEGETAAMRSTTCYGVYAGSYYIPLGTYVYKSSDNYTGEAQIANEEYAALSIYSSAMYELGYIQLGLLRNAEYIEMQLIDNTTDEVVWSSSDEYVSKTSYYSSYGILYGGDIYEEISPSSLGLENNANYSLLINIYREYNEESSTNEVSDSYSQSFYVDYETPQILDISYYQDGSNYYATVTMYDNHYLQAIAVCTGKGSSSSNMSITPQDIYPITTSASGVGQTITMTIDITKANNNATNKYIYFYLVDYAFNYTIYYDTIINSSLGNITDAQTTSNSTTPTTQTNISSSSAISFNKSSISLSVNEEVSLASSTYIKGYDITDTYTWSTSNRSVAVVSEGKVTGLSVGTCVITVTNSAGNSANIVVKVNTTKTITGATYEKTLVSGYNVLTALASDGDTVFDLDLDKEKISLAPGESIEFTYSYLPYNYNYIQNPITINVSYSGSTGVISLVNGVITALAEGDVVITITANSFEIASYTISVCPSVYINDNKVLLACFDSSTTIDLSSQNFIAVASNAFSYASNATSIVLPTSCKVLYEDAFQSNTSIKTVTMTGVTTIYANAFDGCVCLKSIDLTNVLVIGENAFNGCVNLSTVKLSSSSISDMSISMAAFTNCTKLSSFDIDGTAKTSIVDNGTLIMTLNYSDVLADSTITTIGCNSFCNVEVSTLDLSSTSITRIEQNAFKNNTSISKIILPSTLEYIGAYAFYGCTNLANITFNDSNELYIGDYAFAGSKVASVALDGIETTFGDYTFANCSQLIYIDLGIVQKMGTYTFAASTALITASFDEGSLEIGSYCFAVYVENSTNYYHNALVNVVIPSSITTIGEYAFAYCYYIDYEDIDFSGVTTIGDAAFYACKNIESLEFKNVTNIGYGAFAESSIETIKLGVNLTSGELYIDELAFYCCSSLTSVSIPNVTNVTISIQKGAFYKCTALTSTDLKLNNVTFIGDYAFTGCTALVSVALDNAVNIGYGAFADCTALQTVSISKVQTIGDFAFYDTAITSISLPASITFVGQGVFAGNEDLIISSNSTEDYTTSCLVFDTTSDGHNVVYEKLTNGSYMLLYYPDKSSASTYAVLDNTSYIGAYSFAQCESLVNVSIASTVKYVGHGAFYGCTGLKSIRLAGSTIPTLLASYNSSASELYCNFITYESKASGYIVYVETSEMETLISNSYIWSSYFDYVIIYSGTVANDSNLSAFISAVDAINSYDSTSVSAAVTLYNSLTEDEKNALSSTTEGAALISKYNALVSQLNSASNSNGSSIFDNIINSDGSLFDLPTWLVITIVIIVAVAALGLTVGLTMYFSKRMVRKTEKQIDKESNEKKKDIIDIFGDNNDKDKQ